MGGSLDRLLSFCVGLEFFKNNVGLNITYLDFQSILLKFTQIIKQFKILSNFKVSPRFYSITLKRLVKGKAKASRTSLISVHNSFDLNSWRYLKN